MYINFKSNDQLQQKKRFQQKEQIFENSSCKYPESVIIKNFYYLLKSFESKNIEQMILVFSNLNKIAKRQSINDFIEYNQYSISQVIIKSLFIRDMKLYYLILSFLYKLFSYDSPPLLKSLLNAGLINSLLLSVNFHSKEEDAVITTFQILHEIVIESKHVRQMFLDPSFFTLSMMMLKSNEYSYKIKQMIVLFIKELANNELTENEFNAFIVFIREILSFKELSFLWTFSLDIVNVLIVDKNTAETILNDNEFYIPIHEILSTSDDKEVILSSLSLISEYYQYSSKLLSIDHTFIFIFLKSGDEQILYNTFKVISNMINQGFLNIYEDHNIYDILKYHYENSSYKVKIQISYILGNIIRTNSLEDLRKIIEFDFMDNLIQMLVTQDLHFFNHIIGIITKLLRSNITFNPPDIFWNQFEESGGVDILNEISMSNLGVISDRAYRFIDKIYSLRPHDFYNNNH